MAFKQKLKSFLNEIRESASAKSPTEEELAPSQLAVTPSVAKFKEHLKEYNDPQADQELIDSIYKPYFNEEFDPSQHELENMGEDVSLNDINRDRDKLRQQLQAVSRKVSELVLENHPAYAVELTRVMDLQQSLQSANGICASSRGQLHHARQRFTTSSLGLLANYRKRQQLVALLKSLRTIKTLQRTDIRLREMLEEEDYPGAIQLCLECQKAAATFKHYQCISELSSKLQDTLVMIEEALDVALSKTCGNFDKFHYQKVQTAYRLLGKTQTAMDQLHMHFTSAIHNTAFTIVLGYVELTSGRGDTSFQKTHYLDLCKAITPEMFTPCLTDLCKALWEVMKSYYKTMQWHEQHEVEALSVEDDSATSLNRKYIKHKLEHGLARIWGDVQQKVKVYVLSTDLSYFKYEEFIQVLDIVNRLIQVGEEFCGSKSEGLQDSLRKQSINYFRNYHRSRMDELRIFLENEGWELCPVKASFTILMLQEFKFMRSKTEGHGYRVTGLPSAVSDTSISSQGVDFFEKYLDSGSPFDVQNDDEEVEDVLDVSGYADEGHIQPVFTPDSDSDDDVSDELKQEFVDEKTGEAPIKRPSSYRRRKSDKSSGKIPPIVTNTTLNVCRLFGRYMQMMKVLKPIAFDVTICLSQLFDYYLYSIFSFFGSELETAEDYERCLSSKLRTTLKRIRDNLIVESEGSPQQVSIAGVMAAPLVDESRRDKVDHPHLSHMVDLSDENNLYGMPARVVATESLVFLAEQFEFLQRHLEGMIPPAKKAFLQQFYSQTVSTAQELRQPVYMTVASRAIHLEQQVHHMAQVKWDIKDIMSLHSGYVDILLKEFEGLKSRLARIERLVPIPKAVEHVIWEHCIRLANQSFVEGYAGAKKCSNEGRALMQLDFQQFLTKLEKLTDLRPIPGREFVEGYVKAYYFPEAQLESWIREHKEYSPKQLISLINCLSHINKKSRQRLVNFIEELEKNRR